MLSIHSPIRRVSLAVGGEGGERLQLWGLTTALRAVTRHPRHGQPKRHRLEMESACLLPNLFTH